MCNKRGFSSILLLVVGTVSLFSQESYWTVAAAPFDLGPRSPAAAASSATILPSYILELLTGNLVHRITADEKSGRRRASLMTQQQALFLELTAAIKKRDALVLENPRDSAARQKIAAEDKKIRDIKKNIDSKIQELRALDPAYLADLDVPLTGKTKRLLAKQKKEDAKAGVAIENVVLYQDDSASLYTSYRKDDGSVVDNAVLEKDMAANKINGLITGTITVQEEYAAVTSELRLFPGGAVIARSLEIGKITALPELARLIVYDLLPGVESVRPAIILFDLADALPGLRVSVDSNTFATIPRDYPINPGRHQVSFEAAGYRTETVAIDAESATAYRVSVTMTREILTPIVLSLKNAEAGVFIINGLTAPNPAPDVQVGSRLLLGRFDPPDPVAPAPEGALIVDAAGDGALKVPPPAVSGIEAAAAETVPVAKTAQDAETGAESEIAAAAEAAIPPRTAWPGYFTVPPAAAGGGSQNWTVNPYLKDITADIERGRKSLYFSYTLLMLSVPITFITLGEFNKNNNAAAIATPNSESYRIAAQTWNTVSTGAIALTAALGVNFVWHLLRYMKAANPVIPVTAQPY